MKKINSIKTKLAVLASVAALALYSTGATAAVQTVTANIAFANPVSLTLVNNIDFGIVTATNASTYVMNTADGFSVSAGTGVNLGGTPASGEITVAGSATQTISISPGNYTASGVGSGVVPSAATCAYNGGAAALCSTMTGGGLTAPGAGRTLLLGVTLTVDAAQTAGSAATPTFDITVNYG